MGRQSDGGLCWEEALRLNLKYEPARESLDMLENRENLKQKVESLNKLDFKIYSKEVFTKITKEQRSQREEEGVVVRYIIVKLTCSLRTKTPDFSLCSL